MRILSNRFDLEFGDGETMTVEIVDSQGTQNLVNYVLNEKRPDEEKKTLPQQQPYTKTLTRTPPDAVQSPSYLTVTVHFAANSGGSFMIRVSGNYGGKLSEYEQEQEPPDPNQQLNYTLTIVPGGGRP